MGHLFCTGDTHQSIDISKLNSKRFPYSKELTKEDILVIMGDAGFVWSNSSEEKYWRKWLDNKPWTTFCVLGNHENYNLINDLPIENFNGTPARRVSDSIWYAETGEIYNFDGLKCLVINGADSTDKSFRKENISWWRQERITQEQINKALSNLVKEDNTIDFLFTHTGGIEIAKFLGFNPTPSDILLNQVIDVIKYRDGGKHFCGHYHEDKYVPELDNRARIVYDDIIMIK